MRRTVLLCLTALSLALWAAPAYAGIVTVDTSSYRYVAGVAETNVVSVTVTGQTFTLTDSAGVSADISAACTPGSATETTCTMPVGFKLELELEDLDDTASVSGEAFVHGAPGNDQLTGGTGP